MSNKYTEEEIQRAIEEIKKRRPNSPDLATREFAIRTLDKTRSLLGKLAGNMASVSNKENKKSKKAF